MSRQVDLVVILADTTQNMIGLMHLNEHKPFIKRAVRIRLTPEQVAAIEPRPTGMVDHKDRFEETLECWLEWPQQLCSTCEGSGLLKKHSGPPESPRLCVEKSECSRCNGTGRSEEADHG